MNIILTLSIGLLAGTFGGALGLGGGAIMVPAMVLLFGMTQHQAQGTSLAALLPPVFFFAVWRYYQAGNVNVPMAVIIAIGFIFGALLGAHLVQEVPDALLKKIFGIFIMLIGLKMTFF